MNPRSVAVIGASEDQTKFGGRLYRMLLHHGYEGTVYPINPGRDTLFGLKTHASLQALPAAPDMVVLALPRDKVKDQIAAAAERGAKGGIIITAKFSDAGPEGAAIEREIVEIARAKGMRLIGPNCLGLISAANRVVLCSSPVLERKPLPLSPIGLVSQSGALMATLFDRAWDRGIGFTHGVSVGNQADIELCDVVDYLIADPRTRVICTYIEGIKDAERFVRTARKARAAGKPWLAVKAGRTEAGSKAAFSHTASIAGSHDVLAAVCRDEGVTLLDDPNAMILLAAELARVGERPVRRIGIFTTSGGGGALAADAVSAHGLELARFTATTEAAFADWYSPGQAQNPVDVGGRKSEAKADLARATVAALLDDANTDGLLLPITTAPDVPGLCAQIADGVQGERGGKPAFVVMEPGKAGDGGRAKLVEGGVTYTDTLGEAVEALTAWATRAPAADAAQAPARPGDIPGQAPAAAATLNESDSKALLAQYGVPVGADLTAASVEQAVQHARSLGYPVVMKIVSPDVVHKSDAGGVRLDIQDDEAVAAAWRRIHDDVRKAVPQARIDGISIQNQARGKLELIVGARRDPQFGPVVVVGAGGILVELLPTPLILRAPAAPEAVKRLLQTLPVWPILAGYRGTPLAVDAVVDAIVRASWLAADLGSQDFEFDINPLIVAADRCVAVDARIRIGNTEETSA
ncbi:CoA-binding protein [Verticiella sediminum]|uniref:CoA-binding protein n=2 Tax=Verticiella sediminum TaxID=1247510 RepID=A0A556AQD3_9BURK|nr:CoA-binding protein [Verticiella sediminum]